MEMIKELAPEYVLGHSEKELQRLIDQSLVYEELTDQFLAKAGICRGMRVLDLGAGAGDVSFLAARIVGPEGAVLGVDRSSDAVALARRRARAMHLDNVTFVESDIPNVSLKTPVDAVIGRLVLMYLPDPAAALRRLAEHVRPGGLLAFQEFDFTHMPTTYPYSPLFEKVASWIVETLNRGGADTKLGFKLREAYLRAGLPAPQMSLGSRVEGGADSYIYEFLVQTIRSMLPMAEAFGVVSAREAQLDTLAVRLRDELPNEGVVVLPQLVGAWTQTRV